MCGVILHEERKRSRGRNLNNNTMETRRTSLSSSTTPQQPHFDMEMTQRPHNNTQHRMRSVSVVAYPTTTNNNNNNNNMNNRYNGMNNHHRALEISSGFSGGGRKSSTAGGRRISLPNNLRKLPLRKKSSSGSKFKSIFEPTIDPWDEIFMIYVSSMFKDFFLFKFFVSLIPS